MIQVLLRNEYINKEKPVYTYTVKSIEWNDPQDGFISLIDNQGNKRFIPFSRILEIVDLEEDDYYDDKS